LGTLRKKRVKDISLIIVSQSRTAYFSSWIKHNKPFNQFSLLYIMLFKAIYHLHPKYSGCFIGCVQEY
jgi:hypothetical protein